MKNIELSEINFKNKEADFIELRVYSPVSIKIKDDSLITEINEEDLENISYILISFKSPKEGIEIIDNTLHIYKESKGLTGTTEQIIVESEDQIIDIACWQNSSPPESELRDMKELNLEGKCINSDDIKQNQSIAFIENSWQIFLHPTPGSENIYYNSPPSASIKIQKGSVTNEIPFSINLDGSASTDPDNDELTYLWIFPTKIITDKNPPSYRFQTSGIHEISLTVIDPSGLSSTETLKIEALTPESHKESALLLEQIIENHSHIQKNTKSPENLPLFIPILLIISIFLLVIIKIITTKTSLAPPSDYK